MTLKSLQITGESISRLKYNGNTTDWVKCLIRDCCIQMNVVYIISSTNCFSSSAVKPISAVVGFGSISFFSTFSGPDRESNRSLNLGGRRDLRERDHLEDLGVDGRVILKLILKCVGWWVMDWIVVIQDRDGWWDLRERDNLEDLGVDWRVILKFIWNAWDGE